MASDTQTISITGVVPDLAVDDAAIDELIDSSARMDNGDIVKFLWEILTGGNLVQRFNELLAVIADFRGIVDRLIKIFGPPPAPDAGPPRGSALELAHAGVEHGVDVRALPPGLAWALLTAAVKFGWPVFVKIIKRIKDRQGRGMAF